MRILWFSNAPWKGSGYGVQTRLAMQHLTNLGHEMAIACNFGLRGGVIEGPKGVRFYPGGYDSNSNDIVQAHADDFKADVIISLYDAWPLKFAKLKTPWIPWCPIDHQPVPKIVLEAIRPDLYPPKNDQARTPATAVAVYSEFGRIELEKAGVDAVCIPLGVETDVYKPGDKGEARKRLGLPADVFLIGMVGANNFYPSRKCIPQALQAFAQFHKRHPDSMLYLHCEEQGIFQGINVPQLVKALGLGDEFKICDQYEYLMGFPDAYMVDIYNAMDVLLSPSMAEGFGAPILEAQACGTPVIATDFSSMTELVSGGWLITEYERWWEPQEAWQVLPHVSAILYALEEAWDVSLRSPRSGDVWDVLTEDERTLRSRQARAKAEQYDFERVVAPMWDEFLRGPFSEILEQKNAV